MRGMPAFGDLEQLAAGHARGDAADLREAAVLVADALHGEHGQRIASSSASMFQSRNGGCSQMRFQPQKAESALSW